MAWAFGIPSRLCLAYEFGSNFLYTNSFFGFICYIPQAICLCLTCGWVSCFGYPDAEEEEEEGEHDEETAQLLLD